MSDEIFFEADTPLGFTVRVTRDYWNIISMIKHPAVRGREADIKALLESPDEIRQSRSDNAVFLFYRAERPKRWLCSVVKQLNGYGFLITAYPTDGIKEGERLWIK
jgi:hypothetical protein